MTTAELAPERRAIDRDASSTGSPTAASTSACSCWSCSTSCSRPASPRSTTSGFSSSRSCRSPSSPSAWRWSSARGGSTCRSVRSWPSRPPCSRCTSATGRSPPSPSRCSAGGRRHRQRRPGRRFGIQPIVATLALLVGGRGLALVIAQGRLTEIFDPDLSVDRLRPARSASRRRADRPGVALIVAVLVVADDLRPLRRRDRRQPRRERPGRGAGPADPDRRVRPVCDARRPRRDHPDRPAERVPTRRSWATSSS